MLILCFTDKGLVLVWGPGWAPGQDPALRETGAPRRALKDAGIPPGFGGRQELSKAEGRGQEWETQRRRKNEAGKATNEVQRELHYPRHPPYGPRTEHGYSDPTAIQRIPLG